MQPTNFSQADAYNLLQLNKRNWKHQLNFVNSAII